MTHRNNEQYERGSRLVSKINNPRVFFAKIHHKKEYGQSDYYLPLYYQTTNAEIVVGHGYLQPLGTRPVDSFEEPYEGFFSQREELSWLLPKLPHNLKEKSKLYVRNVGQFATNKFYVEPVAFFDPKEKLTNNQGEPVESTVSDYKKEPIIENFVHYCLAPNNTKNSLGIVRQNNSSVEYFRRVEVVNGANYLRTNTRIKIIGSDADLIGCVVTKDE